MTREEYEAFLVGVAMTAVLVLIIILVAGPRL
jgi:hypothetical protein